MNKTRHYIRILLLVLLLGGMGNEAWAQVTYHILTLPFSTLRRPYADVTNPETGRSLNLDLGAALVDFRTNIRVEAFRCTSNEATVGLPNEFKSKGAKNFKYYVGVSNSATVAEKEGKVSKSANPEYVWGYNDTKYFLYTINGSSAPTVNNSDYSEADEDDPVKRLKEGSAVPDGVTDIYVTYEYDSENTPIDLSGTKEYNIQIGDRMLYYNTKRDNRPGLIPINNSYFRTEDLGSDDLISDKYGTGRFYIFRFLGKDPYNIVIQTAYAKNATSKGDTEWYWDQSSRPHKEFRGATIFSSIKDGEATGRTTMWLSSNDHRVWKKDADGGKANGGQYYDVPGFFRGPNSDKKQVSGMTPIFNSFALLNHVNGDYALAASKMNVNTSTFQPMIKNNQMTNPYLASDGSSSGTDYWLNLEQRTSNNIPQVKFYQVRKYKYSLNTHLTGTKLEALMKWSDYGKDVAPVIAVPQILKRKYVDYLGIYTNATLTTEFKSFNDIFKDDEPDVEKTREVWVKYGVASTLPFQVATSIATEFNELKWYNIYADKEQAYFTWYDKNDGNKFNTHSNHSQYPHDSHFAFIGDPYELYVVSRQASEDNNKDKYYLKLASTNSGKSDTYVAVSNGKSLVKDKKYYTSNTGTGEFTATGEEVATGSNYYRKLDALYKNPLEAGATVETWEIVYDDDTNNYKDCFRLRKFNSYVDSIYVGWDKVGSYPLNGNQEVAVRLSVLEPPMMYYTYHIVNGENNIAVKATEEQGTGITLSYKTIPEIIRSPFLEGATLTFRTYKNALDFNNGASTSIINGTDGTNKDGGTYITIETTNSDEEAPWQNHIFVFYNKAPLPALSTITPLNNTKEFNVSLNDEFIYFDNAENVPPGEKIKSQETISSVAGDNAYLWILEGEDPYAMIIQNKEKGYVKVDGWVNKAVLGWTKEKTQASRFIINSNNNDDEDRTYEVMATAGDAFDAGKPRVGLTTYYNIGREDEKTVRIYSNEFYQHGYSNLKFQLTESEAHDIVYHLIDKQGKDLLQVTARQANGAKAKFPTNYWSPLVKTYHYYTDDQFIDPTKVGTPKPIRGNSSSVYELIAEQIEKEKETVAEGDHIFVTYEANNLVDMHHTTMYLLEFAMGTPFYAEDGSDGLEKQKVTPVYPYCNGDCNFNIYGKGQFDTQQNGAASTRTRWAWYVESDDDPYHVKIFSRQSETYDGVDRNAYFATYIPDGQKNSANKVVTNLVWPNISGVQATDYMVLGNVGQYQLVTSYKVDVNGDGDTDDAVDRRYTLNSFEQYWKTYDLIRRKVLNQSNASYPDNPSDPREVPETPFVVEGYTVGAPISGHAGETWNNRTYLEYEMDWHSYSKMAYAKRWNGYNNKGETKKGWEKIEHWFETVKMGEGYFNFVPFTVDPALILLDQHGWEIMRKPLPYSDKDPKKEDKKNVLRTYDSPMVKEYIFWASAKKRSGFHQYYALDKRIGGSNYSSTSLYDLPPWGSENVLDAKGNHNDEYVTYIVKDEYVQSYRPGATPTADPFLIRQGSYLAKNDGTANIAEVDVSGRGGVSQYVIDNIGQLTLTGSKKNELWYVKPNPNIDAEMGYAIVDGKKNYDWGTTNPNAYGEDSPYYSEQVADLIVNTAAYKALTTDDDKTAFITKYGQFTFSNGFDPYNIQISSRSSSIEKFFTVNMENSQVEEGIMQGTYTATPPTVTLNEAYIPTVSNGTGYDNNKWFMTNQTFMAVQDKDGNMQLMPRFDHNLRMQDFCTLVTPNEDIEHSDKLEKTYTQLYRPYVYNYRIIDNSGREALRYKSGGELVPQTPDHFKSPLAKDFKYYKTASYEEGTKTYSIEESTANDTSPQEITETSSMAGAGKYDSGSNGNPVYVRYAYDEEADVQHVLQGKWLSMQIADEDKYYNDGIKTLVGEKDAAKNDWHWKFLRTPHTAPDPYAVQILNDSHGYNPETNKPIPDKPMSAAGLGLTDASEAIISANAASTYQYFALLNHTASDGTTNGYALAVARTAIDDQYWFVNGYPASANIAKETGFRNTSCAFDESVSVNSKVVLIDDIGHKYIYLIYTNDKDFAISATQTHSEARENDYLPVLPASIQSPLLNANQFVFYEKEEDMDVEGMELENLYGLYEDADTEHESHVYVRYKPYDTTVTEYLVPNHKTTKDGHVARNSDSNDAPIHLDGKLPYNIVWYDDNMMKGNGSNVKGEANQALTSDANFVWRLDGDDPYAIKMKKGTDSYISISNTDVVSLSATPTTFMLLPQGDYEYGVLAVTGNKDKMLTMSENNDPEVDDNLSLAATNPTKFIIFALGAENIIYHLVIANIKDSHGTTKWTETIPWRKPENRYNGAEEGYDWNEEEKGYKAPALLASLLDSGEWPASYKIDIEGTSMRDLTSVKTGEGTHYAGEKYQLGDTKPYPDLNGSASKANYCVEVGPISLGDNLSVPSDFYRPNVVYTFVVHDIQEDKGGGTWVSNPELNAKFKGMEISSRKMSTVEDFLGKKVYINIVYTFDGDLDSNSGEDFVKSIKENKWYTLETMIDGTSWLAQYTNAWGFELKEGYGTHYTNDFLWTPIGDPYGFQLYNRYMDINSGGDNLGEKNKVLMTEVFLDEEETVAANADAGQTTITSLTDEDDTVDGTTVFMGDFKTYQAEGTVIPGQTKHTVALATISANSVYELLEGNKAGYFKFHPVVDPNQHGLNVVDAIDANGAEHRYVRLCKASAEFTFGLNKELMKPYFDRAGYVGGLKKSVYENEINKDVVDEMKKSDETMDFALLMKAQSLVYDLENNIVPFETGYYRLHSPLGLSGIEPSRYASGYTHKIELDGYNDGVKTHVIPMHFYEMNSEQVRTFTDLKEGFTFSHATRGDLPISPVEKDPASIFYFEKTGAKETRVNTTKISTEGLYVKGTVAKGTVETAENTDFANNRAAAVMTTTAGQELFVMDIGGGILLIHDNETANGRRNLKYFSFDYSKDLDNEPTIYNLKMTFNTHTDHAKWCMQPVQKSATKGVNEMGLKLDLHRGGDGYNYATFYAPFDVLLTDAEKDIAYICNIWDTEMIHLKKVGKYNTEDNGYKGSNQFVPAGTPVIIRSTATSTTLALPKDNPSPSPLTCMFTGKYLEQLLTTLNDGDNDVYTFGLPVDGISKVIGYDDNDSEHNGQLNAVLPHTADNGVGFYINCNPNREAGGARGLWLRNNRYVHNNRIYYRVSSGSGARQGDFESMPDFIPVVFDDDEEEDDEPIGESLLQRPHDNRVYDLLGRCVATGEEVVNGTWRSKVASGIYILNGRKIYVK